MAEIKSEIHKTKKGIEVITRSANLADAVAISDLARAVLKEEIYNLTSFEEFKVTDEEQIRRIDSYLKNPNHLLLVAEIDSKIIGQLDFTNGRRKRTAHTGELGMSVASIYRNDGIGALLLKVLIDWAKTTKQIEKIDLCVHANNDRAIALYKKMGFVVEGVRRYDLKYGENEYVDTIVMGQILFPTLLKY